MTIPIIKPETDQCQVEVSKFIIFIFHKNRESGLIFDNLFRYLVKINSLHKMKTYKTLLFITFISILSSCGAIKSTIKNIDNSAIKPVVKEGQFIITEYAKDSNYGYDKDYPINLGFENEIELTWENYELLKHELLNIKSIDQWKNSL